MCICVMHRINGQGRFGWMIQERKLKWRKQHSSNNTETNKDDSIQRQQKMILDTLKKQRKKGLQS